MALKYRSLDVNGDYTFGINQYKNGVEAVAQAIQTRMYLFYGEWWENLTDGLPMFQSILGTFGGDDNRQAVDLIISERILGTLGVSDIASYSSTFINRRYSANAVVNTIYGTVTLTIGTGLNGTIEVRY
jgi:hypothetical protein